MPATRRRLLRHALLGATALAAGGCGLLPDHRPAARTATDGGPGSGSGVAVTAGPGASVVQIVAHADDDLYFINPETERFLRAGVPLTSVYLTAGESAGLGPKAPAVRAGEVPVLDRAQYAAERFYGLRRAYARMVTGDLDSPWTRTAVLLRSGTAAEVATLRAAPHVRLVLLNLLEAGDRRRAYRGRSLPGLINGTAHSVPTLVLADGPVTSQYSYTREKLLAALDQLLTEARPTLVCTLDHDPEHKPGRHGRGVISTDHADHTATAQFVVTAVEHYRPPAGAPVPVLHSYRGYANQLWPQTLDAGTVAAKTALLVTYSGRGLPCGVRTGCGDHNVDNLRPTRRRFASTQHRYQGDIHWLRPLPDGRLTAFAVLAGQVVQWSQAAPGGTDFAEPVPLSGPPVLGQVAAVSLPDGRIRLFALRHGGLLGPPATQVRSVITCAQSAPGGPFGPWHDLGGPDGTRGAKAREIGLPYAAVDTGGRVHLVLRGWNRALHARTLTPDGRWSSWRRLPGPVDVQDGLCLLPRADGRTEIYAGTRTALYRWTLEPGGSAAAVRLPLQVPACAPSAVELPGRRVRLFLRPAASASVVVHDHDERTGRWSPGVPHSTGGYGPVAVVPASGGSQLTAARDDSGTVTTRTWPAGPPATGHPALLTGTPSLTRDRAGRTYLATIGADGRLAVTRADPAEPRA
ncbi:PIG-L family deacetylase [Actinacidiphila acididurans]|uniref:PIG-L family deacetylase n=1 Tax=Actinacidiphila acididurans TaxID=2784346 RepID=A0ABS2TZ58_9ACTN|nr:PIG-L family deacetylase [Actinacidiphila acididurans]MBM9507791.1 PIG-L family deacetylase [Actinacidiphila acididurans]